MKQTIFLGICASLLLSVTAWSAPKAARKAKPAGMDEIRVHNNYSAGADRGGNVGSSETWTIRADDTAIHDRSYSTIEAFGPDIQGDVGTLKPGSFAQLLEYLQWTNLLNPKYPGDQGELSVSLKRGGKVKSASVAGSAAYRTTDIVVRNLVQDVVWRTTAQHKAGTGLSVIYQVDDPLTEAEAAKPFPRPIFSVLNKAGKEVAVLKPNTEKERAAFLALPPVYTDKYGDNSIKDTSINSYLTLAPGTYRFAFKKLDGAAPAGAPEVEWRVIGDVAPDATMDTATVTAGQFNTIVIRVVKKGAPKI